MLIVGCGNRDRGDDAAGLIVAAKLRQLGINAVGCSGETFALLELWGTADDVVVIDAVMTGASPGTVHVWNAHDVIKLGKCGSSTHALGLAETIELARTLHRLPARLRIFGIEGRRFKVGTALSIEVRAAVQEVANRIVLELEKSVTLCQHS